MERGLETESFVCIAKTVKLCIVCSFFLHICSGNIIRMAMLQLGRDRLLLGCLACMSWLEPSLTVCELIVLCDKGEQRTMAAAHMMLLLQVSNIAKD